MAVSRPGELSTTYKRATFYLRREQIRAIKLFAVTAERQVSEVVREAVEQYLQPYAELFVERERRWPPVACASGVNERQLSMFVTAAADGRLSSNPNPRSVHEWRSTA